MFLDITTNIVTGTVGSKVTISGTSKFIGEVIEVREAGVKLGTTTSNADGTWSIDVILTDGKHTITAAIPGQKDHTEGVTVTLTPPPNEDGVGSEALTVTVSLAAPPDHPPGPSVAVSEV